MPAVCFYFQVHQPQRLKRYRIFDIGHDRNYFNDTSESNLNNRKIIEKVSRKCYMPANRVMLDLLRYYPEFKISYSLSGVFIEQLEKYSPDTLDSFRELVDTGRVEILSETYYHSLSYLYSESEFKRQVLMHRDLVKRVFGVEPKVFRNTELIYSNKIGKTAEEMGYIGVLAEGADHVLGWRSPNFTYTPPETKNIKLLLKNYKLSDDIAFRFSSRDWAEYPLRADKYAHWISQANGTADIINLFMDYETFGEHQWEDTGIFNFLRHLPDEVYKHPDNYFVTPSEAVAKLRPAAELDVPNYVSWADVERDLSAWLQNSMQQDAIKKLYELERFVIDSNDDKLIEDWRKMTTSDHFYYMCTKWWNDGDVHKYFNPYESPYDAFVSFMNVLQDMKLRLVEADEH
jgi:alpha-amylase